MNVIFFDILETFHAHVRTKRARPLIISCVLIGITLCGCRSIPEVHDLTLTKNPNENAPLTGVLSFSSDRPVQVELALISGNEFERVVPYTQSMKDHKIPVVGLKPDRQYDVVLTITDESGLSKVL